MREKITSAGTNGKPLARKRGRKICPCRKSKAAEGILVRTETVKAAAKSLEH